MARKIFKGISIEPLTSAEISEIQNSGVIDRIISSSYSFIDNNLEKEPGKNIASYLPVTLLTKQDKVKQPIEEKYSKRAGSDFEGHKTASSQLLRAFPVLNDVVTIARTEKVSIVENREKVAWWLKNKSTLNSATHN